MYSVGLILYELYHPFTTESERYRCLRDVRRGCLDDDCKHRWPHEVVELLNHTRRHLDNSLSDTDLQMIGLMLASDFSISV